MTVVPLFHPAAALRTPKLVDQLRADMTVIAGLLTGSKEAADPMERGNRGRRLIGIGFGSAGTEALGAELAKALAPATWF